MNPKNKKPSEMKTLAQNTIILGSPKLLNFVVGILKVKFAAIFLGTTGIGLMNQLLSTVNQIRLSTLSFLPDGMVKLIAQENAKGFDLGKIADIIKTYFLMVLPIGIFTTILGYMFADQLTIYIFGDIKYKLFFIIGFTAIPVSILGASLRAFLKAFKEIKSFAIAEFVIIGLNLITFLPLVYYFNIIGGIIYTTLSFFISFVVIIYLVNKNVFQKHQIPLRSLKTAIFSQKYFKELLAFISVGVVAGTFRVVENISSRAIVVTHLGIDKIGIYSPITKWEGLFIGFILPSVYTYLYPRLSEAKDNRDIINVINDVIRLITFLTLPFIIIAISTRQWIVPLFYSDDFIEATIYLPFHFSFLLFAVWGTIFEQIFAPTGRLGVFLIFVIIFNVISLALVYYFVPIMGLYGYLLRFTIKPLLIVVTFFVFWRHNIDFELKKENMYLILFSIFCAALLVFFKDSNYYFQFFISIVLLFGMVFMLKQKEKEFVRMRLKKILKKFKKG